MWDENTALTRQTYVIFFFFASNLYDFIFSSTLILGEIEPCKLEVKKQAPIRRFAAMKELVGKPT